MGPAKDGPEGAVNASGAGKPSASAVGFLRVLRDDGAWSCTPDLIFSVRLCWVWVVLLFIFLFSKAYLLQKLLCMLSFGWC